MDKFIIRMKYDIMFVGGSFPMPMAGGSINYVYRLLSGIDDLSYFVYTGNNDVLANEKFDRNFNHRIIRSKYGHHVLEKFNGGKNKKRLFFLLSTLQIAYFIIKYRPKVVCYTEITLSTISIQLAKLFRRFKVGLFTYAEEILIDKDRPVHKDVLLYSLKNADFIITVCDYTRNILNDIIWVDEKITKIIPSIPIPTKQINHIKKSDGIIRLLTVSRLEERKGHLDVLDAVSRLKLSHPNIEYRIVGGGAFLNTIEDKVKQLGLESCVKILGKITDEELEKEYDDADIFVMHHKQLSNGDTEGCPTVFLEASSHRLPVVGGEAGGVSDAIKDKETGFICHIGTDELYDYLKLLISDSSLRQRLGENGYKYANSFSVEKQARLFRNVILSYL